MSDFEAELLRKHQCHCPQLVAAGTLLVRGSQSHRESGRWDRAVGEVLGPKGRNPGFPKQVPLLRVLFIQSRGHLLSLSKPEGRCQGRERSILLSMASPERV